MTITGYTDRTKLLAFINGKAEHVIIYRVAEGSYGWKVEFDESHYICEPSVLLDGIAIRKKSE